MFSSSSPRASSLTPTVDESIQSTKFKCTRSVELVFPSRCLGKGLEGGWYKTAGEQGPWRKRTMRDFFDRREAILWSKLATCLPLNGSK